MQELNKKGPGHKNCTLILDAKFEWPETCPAWMRERTHGCWCSAWKLTEEGMMIWRENMWQKPKKGEIHRMPKKWKCK